MFSPKLFNISVVCSKWPMTFIISIFCCCPTLLLEAISSFFFECAGCWFCSLNVLFCFFKVYCFFHLWWSYLLCLALPVEVAYFSVSVILLNFGLWMKLILMVVFPWYLWLKFWVVLLRLVCFLVCYLCSSFFSNWHCFSYFLKCRSSYPEVFIGKGVLKICSWFPGEHPCRSAISIKLLWHGCSPMKLLQTSRTTFLNNTSGWLLLKMSE